ncbi:MAG: hypothetical protein ACXVYI_11885 [Mycobacterium sp.]
MVADRAAGPEDVDGMFKVNWGVLAGPFRMTDQTGCRAGDDGDLAFECKGHRLSCAVAPRGVFGA